MESLEQRTIAKVIGTTRPVPDPLLFRRLPGSGQRRLRRPDDEQGFGLSASAFGFGAGIFFLAYFLFEVPSNLFLERVGARKWIARIMFTWGLISGAHGVRRRRNELLRRARAARHRRGRVLPRHHLLPDAVVPGGLPGAHHRLLHGGDPLSTVIGAPISGLLLGMDGVMGMKGWQWLFILEAVPALVLSVVGVLLPDRSAGRRDMARAGRAGVARRRGSQQERTQARDGARLQRRAGAAEPEGPGAQPRLLRRGGDQLRLELLPAADRQGLRRLQPPGRIHRRAPVRRRRDQHRLVGPALRSQARTPLPPRVSALRRVGGHSGVHRCSTIRR